MEAIPWPLFAASLALVGCAETPSDSGALAEVVRIEAGSFLMGCEADTPGCEVDAQPAHEVRLSAFEIGTTEVSVDDYRACLDDGACTEPIATGSSEPDAPITGLHRGLAEDYCTWAGGRLPTEAEWERAARGSDARTYPWGEAEPHCGRAWTRGCGDSPLVAVDAELDGASPDGLLHMAGNAFEIVSDSYDPAYYEDSPSQDPTGSDADQVHLFRGGQQWDEPLALATFRRIPSVREAACSLCGVRCAWDVGP